MLNDIMKAKEFQFLNGSIKSGEMLNDIMKAKEFQFLNGSIKSWLYCFSYGGNSDFNS